MKLSAFLSIFAFAGLIAACDRNDPPPLPDVEGFGSETDAALNDAPDWGKVVSAFNSFADETFSQSDSAEADLTTIVTELPALVSLDWDDKAFDTATGATRFENLRVTINTDPAFGLSIENAKVWGLDADFIAARLRGERLGETGKIFDRLEGEKVEYFGAADAMNELLGMLEAEMDEDAGEMAQFGFQQLDSTVGRMVISGAALRPFEYKPMSQDQFDALNAMMNGQEHNFDSPEMDEDIQTGKDGQVDMDEHADDDEQADAQILYGVRLAQQVLAVYRTLSIDQGTIHDLETSVKMGSDDISQSVSAKIGFYGFSGVRGLDLERIVLADIRQSQSMETLFDEADPAPNELTHNFQYDQLETTDYAAYEGLKLDKLAGFLAQSEFPGLEERDLLSLGVWQAQNYALRLNDGDIFKVARVRAKADDFVWFIPEAISVDLSGAEIHPGELAGFVLAMIPATPDDAEAQQTADDIETAIDLLDENGLGNIPFNLSGVASWNEGSGDTKFSLSGQADGFGERMARVNLGFPNYDELLKAYQSDTPWDEAIEPVLETKMSFAGLRFFEKDEGGYDKLFGYLHALGQVYEDEGWGATLSGMPPDQLRAFVAMSIRAGKSATKKEYPPAADWIEAIAAYFETSGGSLEILSDPATPLTRADFEAMAQSETPEAEIKRLNISVTHTPQ